MEYKIFGVLTDASACDCTQGCADTVRESALKADSGNYAKKGFRKSCLKRGVFSHQGDPLAWIPLYSFCCCIPHCHQGGLINVVSIGILLSLAKTRAANNYALSVIYYAQVNCIMLLWP